MKLVSMRFIDTVLGSDIESSSTQQYLFSVYLQLIFPQNTYSNWQYLKQSYGLIKQIKNINHMILIR